MKSNKKRPAKSYKNPEFLNSPDARLVRVAFESGADQLFDYALPPAFTDNLAPGFTPGGSNAVPNSSASLAPGQRVRVPFGKANRLQIAFCVEFPDKTTLEQVKIISEIVDPEPLLDQHMMELAHWISRYYCCPLGQVLSAMVPAAVKHQVGMKTKKYLRLTPIALTPDLDNLAIPRSKPARAILHYLRKLLTPQNSVRQPPCHSERREESPRHLIAASAGGHTDCSLRASRLKTVFLTVPLGGLPPGTLPRC